MTETLSRAELHPGPKPMDRRCLRDDMKKPKPYYAKDGVVIYLGDSRDIIGTLRRRDQDLVLADPPYGIDFDCKYLGTRFTGVKVRGDDRPFEPGFLLRHHRVILWGANHYAHKLPPSPTWLIWDKRDGKTSNSLADCEMAWSDLGGPARLIRHMWSGWHKASERGVPRVHPTQKPVAVMQWCIERAAPVSRVIDPFMGSGTTLVAARKLGLRAVGIEIERKYCDVAIKRTETEANRAA